MRRCPVWVASLMLLANACVAPQHPEVRGTRQTHRLPSEIVGDDYEIFVRLPPDYDPTRVDAYSLVFQLDASLPLLDEFDVTSGFASEYEAEGEIAPTIVVGVGYPDPPGPHGGRLRDYSPPERNGAALEGATGGADLFYAFLREELTPWVEQTYPGIAGPQRRALFGHSLGGLFVMYALALHDPIAPWVGGFTAASPALFYDSGSIYTFFAERRVERDVRLLMTVGTLEGPEMLVYFDDFARRFTTSELGGADVHLERYEEDHVGTVSPSFSDGLTTLFSGAAP